MDIGHVIAWVVLGLVAVGLTIWVVYAVRRRGYINSLNERGWQFVNRPSLAITDGLNLPPFGLDFERKTDEQVIGRTSQGVPFQVFDYVHGKLKTRVAVLALPRPLPELAVAEREPRGQAQATATSGPWRVRSDTPAFAQAALASIEATLPELSGVAPVDLTVDGRSLVAAGAPVRAEELERFIEAVSPVAVALGSPDFESFRQPEPATGFGFYRRPTWVFRGDDDAFLERVKHTRGGSQHHAKQVLTGEEAGVTFIALRHTWITTRTVTSTDSEGRTTTRTETTHHREDLLEAYLPASLPFLKFGPESLGWFTRGSKVHFESEAFNAAFDVFAEHAKFASDVCHPRQLEYLAGRRVMPFVIDGNVAYLDCDHDPAAIGWSLDSLRGFLARVPAFVWKDLGIAPPDFGRTP